MGVAFALLFAMACTLFEVVVTLFARMVGFEASESSTGGASEEKIKERPLFNIWYRVKFGGQRRVKRSDIRLEKK